MRGTIRKRYKGSWSLVLDLGYQMVDSTTGLKKRKQKWITFHGTRKQAEAKLTDLVRDANRGEFVEPSKLTVREWLNEWLEKTAKPPRKAQGTYDSYRKILDVHILPALGDFRLQALKPSDIGAYYASRSDTLAPATIQVHHAIISSALKCTLRDGLVTRNAASDVSNKPRKSASQTAHADVLEHVWTAKEAARFLATAKAAGVQPAAFYSLALDSGARKGELAGLKWSDLDPVSGKLTIQRTLLKGRGKDRPEPVFGPTKTRTARTLELSAETLALLRTHRAHQAEIKLANRTRYHDNGLVFAKELVDLQARHDTLGDPLQVNNIGSREFGRLIKAARVRRIKFHGLRRTVATLMLAAGVPAHVVQGRLGHSKIEMTLNIYAHALPTMQQDAASKLAALLHG